MSTVPARQKIALILFGSLLSLILLEAGLRAGGYLMNSLQERRNMKALEEKGAFRILCLGESTTAFGGKDSYPSQLEEILNERKKDMAFTVINKGRIGTNTAAIAGDLEDTLAVYEPDMVITMMGINDGGVIIPYEDVPAGRFMTFLKNLRTYKLARLLHAHLTRTAHDRKGREKERGVFLNVTPREAGGYVALGWCYRDLGRYDEAAEMFRKALEREPHESDVYAGAGWFYVSQGKLTEGDALFKEALAIDPENHEAEEGLGWCYGYQGRYQEALEAFGKAIAIDAESASALIGLGNAYKNKGAYEEAEEAFKKAVAIAPEDYRAYVGLGWCYGDQGNYQEALGMFQKAVLTKPEGAQTFRTLGWRALRQGALARGGEMLARAVDMDPGIDEVYGGLAWCYGSPGRYQEALEMFSKAIEINPRNDRWYAKVAICYEKLKDLEAARAWGDKAYRLRMKYYNPQTRSNYRRVKETVLGQGIRLVCVQYPMRSIEPLKKMFSDTEGVLFVDNSAVFREAVQRSRYEDYFTDIFAGDFGHCTPEGNRLLAENIAQAILREYF
jgi:tetratricopeptide (TPR) repeat protein